MNSDDDFLSDSSYDDYLSDGSPSENSSLIEIETVSRAQKNQLTSHESASSTNFDSPISSRNIYSKSPQVVIVLFATH